MDNNKSLIPDEELMAYFKESNKNNTTRERDSDIKNFLQNLTVGSSEIKEDQHVTEFNKFKKTIPREDGSIDPNLKTNDLITLINAEIKRKGIGGACKDSMDKFNKIGVKQIITKLFVAEFNGIENKRDKTDEDKEIANISCKVEFTDVNLTQPTIIKYKSNNPQMLTPNMARVRNLTYSSNMYIDVNITATAQKKNGDKIVRTASVKNFQVASIPVMVGTKLCNTNNCTRDSLKEMEEDPRDPGGYFIIKGGEWCVDNLENILLNGFHVYRNIGHLREVVRGTFISKPGDNFENSYQIILRYLTNGAITIEITTNKFDKLEIPFYLLFRAFGMTRDYDIFNHIVYGVENDDPVTNHMKQILEKSFEVDDEIFNPIRNRTDSNEILLFIAQHMNDYAKNVNFRKDVNATKYLINNYMLDVLDKYLLPHIGSGPLSRMNKLRFLGHLIHKLLRVEMGILDSTDRDSYKNKRVHSAGVSFAKTFKTQFNFIIVQETKKHFIRDFISTPFSQVQLAESFKASITKSELQNVLNQGITSGNKTITIKKNEVTNRLSSQQLYRKNDLFVISTLNSINTTNFSTAKQNARADEMRRVHPTYLGYICPTQSADTGEKVGMSKQMACTCSITNTSSSYVLKDALLEDPLIIHLDELVDPSQITRDKLVKVFVNGDWIGLCKKSHDLVYKYRMLRRFSEEDGGIHPFTSIVREPLVREVYFWVDVGRLIRPLLIVYNNIEEYIIAIKNKKPIEFKQWIKLTKKHITQMQAGKIKMEDLRVERIIEYITPEEAENCWLSQSLDNLREKVNDIEYQYTHCDIEQAILGLVALTSPCANHTNTARICFQTNQRKQTCGWFTLNWPYRIDKNTFLQYYCEMPLVKTFTDKLTNPSGQNAIVAVMCYSGYGCEDAVILNKSAIDRGLFVGSKFYFEKIELEKNEQFGTLDYARTLDIKSNASYEYIEDGYIKEGTVVTKNTVLVVKVAKIPKPTDQYIYTDRSLVYKFDEPAIVEKVIKFRNQEDNTTIKIKLRSYRPLRVGDKLCLTPDHDVLTSVGWLPINQVTMKHKVATLIDGKYLHYEYPTKVYNYDINEKVYEIKNKQISLKTTLNHKMYVKINDKFQLSSAEEIFKKPVSYKNTAINDSVRVQEYIRDNDMVDIDEYISLLGVFITSGYLGEKVPEIHFKKNRKQISELIMKLNIKNSKLYESNNELILCSKYIYREFKMLNIRKCIPKFVWNLNMSQSTLLLESILSVNKVGGEDVKEYYTMDKQLADDIMRLAFHSGFSAIIDRCANFNYKIHIDRTSIDPIVNKYFKDHVEHKINYTGKVHCLEVPSHIFYVRRDGKACWTGNSSREGCKAICADIIDQVDMPFAEDGLVPDLILNPHSIPTRMCIGQIIEGVMTQLAVEKGVIFDATAFKKIDLDSMVKELEQYGIKHKGKRRLFNGKTGNWIDTHIFIAPNGYQRLQKFVADESYSSMTGPTSALTHQPLSGKNQKGGLRVGEMEKDCLCAHGCMRALWEKFYKHSDGITMPVCRICGNPAIINERYNIYKCNYCGDDADIVYINTCWAANIFFHETAAMNVKQEFELEPHTYSIQE